MRFTYTVQHFKLQFKKKIDAEHQVCLLILISYMRT